MIYTDSIRNDIDTLQINRIRPITVSNTKDIGWEFDQFWIDSTICPKDTVGSRFSFQIAAIYPIHSPSSVNLKAMQKAFIKIWSQTDSIDIQEAFDMQVDGYVELARSYEEDLDDGMHMGYHYSKSVSLHYVSKNIATIEMFESSYEGGAHNVFGLYYHNIATDNGTIIDEELLFVPNYKDSLTELIQNEIIRRNNLTNKDEHIQFITSLSDVKPNKNFYFENTGITYLYNVYEIAGFMYGPIKIHLPYEKIIPLVKKQYLPLIQSIQKEKIYELSFISSEDGVLRLDE